VLALILVAFAPKAVAGRVSASTDPLVVRTSTTWGYSMLLPASWQFRNASYPSDHSTLIWSDPVDAAQKLQIVFSGCYGCSHNLATGAPRPAVGGNLRVTSTYSISPTRLAYAAVSSNDPYPDNGLVIVTTQGYTQIDCWVPQSEHHIATLVLNSYQTVPISTSPAGQTQTHSTRGGGVPSVATVAGGIGGVLLLFIVLGILLYFLPTIIALLRQHHQRGAVFAINLLLGWTLIGWAVALAMSMSAKRQPPAIVQQIVGGAAPPVVAQPSRQGPGQPWTQPISQPEPSPPAIQPMAPPTGPLAGWYADPQTPGQMRRWDGVAWTDETRSG